MDLRDVLYIIDGSVEVTRLVTDESVYEAVLFDNIHDPCLLQGKDLKPEPGSEWRYALAKATGPTPRAALTALTERIEGTSLGHSFPIMWKSSVQWIRIPSTINLGDIDDSVPKAPRSEPEPETDAEPAVAPV